jgi:hypothetical protein
MNIFLMVNVTSTHAAFELSLGHDTCGGNFRYIHLHKCICLVKYAYPASTLSSNNF